MSRILPTLSLFTSFSTLFCCALPALMVAIGAGATLAGVVSNVPQLVWLSEHKLGLFIFSGIMLSIAGFSLWKSRNAACPADKTKACGHARKAGKYVYAFSLTIYLTGAFFAYVAPYII